MKLLPEDKDSKKIVSVGFIFLVIGLAGLIWPLYSLGIASETAFLNEVADQIVYVDQLSETNKPSAAPSIDPNSKNIKDRLIIQKAGISLALTESPNSNVLWKSGWVFPNGVTPGQTGNTVLFGHRFRYLPPVSNTLYHLDKIEFGDEFQIQWKGQTLRYAVSEIKIIQPTDLSVLDQTDDSRVTIITCWPLFSTEKRLVVIGSLIK